MRNKAGDSARLNHIYNAILEIEKYLSHSSFEDFQSNSMMQFATVKQLEIIGEAANHLTQDIRNINKDIKWTEIIGLRNILIHEYFGIDIKIIWDIIIVDIPLFKSQITDIINQV